MDQNAFLRSLGFPEWTDVTHRTSIAHDHPLGERSGIYVLGFANGHHYVGKSANVSSRFRGHSQAWTDLTHMTFQPFPGQDLAALEKEYIQRLRQQGFLLRNFPQVAEVNDGLDLTAQLSPDERHAWRAGNDLGDDAPRRTPHPLLVPPDYHKMKVFHSLPYSAQVLAMLRTYLLQAIPLPRRTELVGWSVSCLPVHTTTRTVYCRVNLRGQEVFAVGTNADSGDYCSIFMATSPLATHLGPNWKSRLWAARYETTDRAYKAGGDDQIQILATDLEHLERLLALPGVRQSVAQFNMHLMDPRTSSLTWRGTHSPGLVDAALSPAPPRSPRR